MDATISAVFKNSVALQEAPRLQWGGVRRRHGPLGTCTSPIRRGRRRGLAPVELVLSLPILLLVMALMINFGTVACWKVRALGAARNSAWGNRPPRSTASFPRPAFWPPPAEARPAGLPSASDLDGPQVTLLDPGGLVVPPQTDVMDPTLGLLQGSAHLARQFPLLRKLGPYDLNATTELLDNTWEFQRMGLPSNEYVRIPLIYTLPPAPGTAVLAAAYSTARQAILNLLLGSKALWPLDRDEEFIYYGSLGLGPGRQDFHPRPQAFCSLDRQEVQDRVYGTDQPMAKAGLIDFIQGGRGAESLAKKMAHRFIQLYQYVINNYQRVTGRSLPPQLQQQLQQNISTLNRFLQTLQ